MEEVREINEEKLMMKEMNEKKKGRMNRRILIKKETKKI